MFNPVAPYQHLLHTVYLSVLDISEISTCLRVVMGHELISTSPAFMRTSASHPSGPNVRLAKKQ